MQAVALKTDQTGGGACNSCLAFSVLFVLVAVVSVAFSLVFSLVLPLVLSLVFSLVLSLVFSVVPNAFSMAMAFSVMFSVASSTWRAMKSAIVVAVCLLHPGMRPLAGEMVPTLFHQKPWPAASPSNTVPASKALKPNP
jgi:chromate transport protein ChrA